jgi:hypothetical protein
MHNALPEFEDELEGEYESEDFDLGGVVRGLLGESELEDELESEYESEFELESEDELEGEWEDEYEGEYEFEDEGEALANPLLRAYPDAMMEHLGAAAAEAETEAEAEAFIGALVPLAAGLARAAAPHIARATPQLVRGLSHVARTLRRNPSTRPLVRALPTIASRTTRSLARHVAHGRPITPRYAIRTLAGQTQAVLSRPHTRRQVMHRARALDRRYHQAVRTGRWWTGAAPAPSATAVRALAQRPRTPGSPWVSGPGVRYGLSVPANSAMRGAMTTPVRRVGAGRRRRNPTGLSTVWIPVTAWCGSTPPRGVSRY